MDHLTNLDGLTFQPWVGADYWRSPMRLLVLGESHYSWSFKDPKWLNTAEFTRTCVRDYLEGGRHQFWTRTTALLGATTSQRHRVWSSVAYAVYVQRLLSKGTRPTGADWQRAAGIFDVILRELRPERILVLGKGTWNNLLKSTTSIARESAAAFQGAVPFHVGDTEAQATFVNHPRSRGFQVSAWHSKVERLGVAG